MTERKVFLSYLRVNEVRVRGLYDRLSGAGFEPWMDVINLGPGRMWEEATEKAIRESDFFLACLTKGAFASEGFFKKEIEWALDEKSRKRGTYLIPVKLEPCKVPESLQRFHWLDLYKQGGWERLLQALRDPDPPRVMLIELELDGSPERFDEEEFKARLGNVVGADIKRIRITGIRPGSIKVTVEGDGEELTRIVELLRDSKEIQRNFSAKTGLKSVAYIQNGERHTFRVRRRLVEVPLILGVIAGFVAGVLGNLLADLIRQEWFSNPFTSRQAVVVILMALAGLGASIGTARRPLSLPKLSRFWPGHQPLASVVAFVLLATIVAAPLSLGLRGSLSGVRDCNEVRVSGLEFSWSAERLKYSGSEPITLRYLDLYNRQNLAGRAALSNLPEGEQCACEWWGDTNELARQQLSPLSEAKDCIFSIPLQDGVTDISLTLNVGRRAGASGFETAKSFDFKIKVQR